MSELRLGALGAGMVFERYARACGAVPGVRIVAVCDPDPTLRATRAASGLTSCETPEQLLSLPLDAVLVLAPNAAHGGLVATCLEAGLPTLCEKPLATTACEAADLVQRAEARGVPLFPAFHVRHRPEIVFLFDQLRSPIVRFEQYWLEDWRGGPAWYFRAADSGGGVLLDVGTNLVDWIGRLVPALEVVDAHADVEGEVELDCTVNWAFGAGTGVTQLSWRGCPEHRSTRVSTADGHDFELLHDQRCVRVDGKLHGPWQVDEYVAVLENFKAHVRAPDVSPSRRAVSDLQLIANVYAKLGLSFGR